jgi:methionine synthase II (cobalamin-independent)
MLLILKKTIIGSFPRFHNSLDDSIKTIIDLQLANKIDIISDGEQRYDMIGYFHQIPGLIDEKGKLCIGKKIQSLDEINEFEKISDFIFSSDYIRKLGSDVLIKTALTGPITLGMTCAMNGMKSYYTSVMDTRIYEDISLAIQPIIIRLLELGSLVQIDEPGLSGGFMRPEIAVKIINNMLEKSIAKEKWRDKLSIHVCGSISRVKNLFGNLLDLNTSVLSLAFSGNIEKENLKIISKKDIEKASKKIGFGCIGTQVSKINDVDSDIEIIKRLEEISRLIDLNNVAYVHPDCGLRNNSIDVVERILRNLSSSVDSFLE